MAPLNQSVSAWSPRRWFLSFDRGSWAWASFLALLAASVVVVTAAPGQDAASEYQVKAAFLYNFGRFVQWPAQEEAVFRICVLGEDPFGSALEETLQDKTVHQRKLLARRIERVEEAPGCQILFVSSSEEGHLRQILAALRGRSVLTVSELPRFAERGGMISFRLENNRVRFDINLGATERARLTVSSQLLKLARIVRDEGRGGT